MQKCTVQMPRFTHPGEKKAPIIRSPMGFISSPFIAPKSRGLCKNKTRQQTKNVASHTATDILQDVRHDG